MQYRAGIKWRGINHPVQKFVHARKGYRYPATAQTFAKPNGAKIVTQYDNVRLLDLARLNSWFGFWVIRRIGGFLFNQSGNQKWAKKWTKIFGVQARVPYPLSKGDKALAQGVLCDTNEVTVVEERGGYCRILPAFGQLTEVEIGSNAIHAGGLRWRIYPDKKTKQIWMEKKLLTRIS